MKKVLSILLLVIFLFNVGGYYLAYWALEYKLDQALSVRIDRNQFAEEETITIRIPVSLPYPIQEHDFERVDGTFEYNGEYFKLVKHKLEKNTLIVVCLKNHDQKAVAETLTDYVKLANDLPGNAKKALVFFGKLLKDYDQAPSSDLVGMNPWEQEILFTELILSWDRAYSEIPGPPPRPSFSFS